MNLCSKNHEEVCYEGHECPACEEMSTRDDTIKELRDEVSDLKRSLDAAESALGAKE